MRYLKRERSHRKLLAEKLLTALAEADFIEERASSFERVFYRTFEHDPAMRIQVGSKISGYGENARCWHKETHACIRVLYRKPDGTDKNVTGHIGVMIPYKGEMDSICELLLSLIQETYSKASSVPRCSRCETPTFLSTNGNYVCADICWKRKGH